MQIISEVFLKIIHETNYAVRSLFTSKYLMILQPEAK